MLSPDILRKLEAIERRFEEPTHQLSDPAVASSGERFRKDHRKECDDDLHP